MKEPATATPARAVANRVGPPQVRRISVAALLGALVLLIVAAPLIQGIQGGDLIETALMTLVLVVAVPAIGGQPRTLVLAILLVAPGLVAKWINHYRPDLVPPPVPLIAGMLFMVFVIGHFLGFILRARRVDSEVLCAGVATYLLMALLWSLAYLLTARLDPEAFAFSTHAAPEPAMDGFNALYFSFVTLSTIGYGDIVPVARVARMLAIVEATTGMFYVAIFISRLVALYSTRRFTHGPRPRDER